MQYRNLNGESISLLGFGGLRLDLTPSGIKKSEEIVDYSIAHGVNYFDTAYGYIGGKSEEFLGRVLSKYDRKSYNIATKIPASAIKADGDFERYFAIQLKRLKTDYIDYFLIHNINSRNFHLLEKNKMYEQLLEKKRNGQIRHLGFSFHDTPALLRKVVDTYDFDFGQIQLNYMDYTIQDAKTQYEILRQKNLPIVVMEPNRGGVLSTLSKEACDVFARGGGGSPTSYSMRWVMSFPQVMCVLSGMTNMEHTTDNIHTAESFTPIIAEEQKLIDEALKIYQSSGTVPCTGCRYCIDCPKQINIPEIFSLYNQYKLRGSTGPYDIGRSKEMEFLIRNDTTAKIERVSHCINCNYCSNQCPQHIDIPAMLKLIYSEDRRLRSTARVPSSAERSLQKTLDLAAERDFYINFDIKNIRFPKDIFKLRSNPEGILEFFRQGRHTFGAPKPKEARWLKIPITFPLQKQKRYVLSYNVKSTLPMKRVFFIEVAGQTQVFDMQINSDEWTNGNIEFTSNLNGSVNLVFTATDLPICGNTLFIKKLSIFEHVN